MVFNDGERDLMRKLDIAIVGCGTSGLTAACF